MIEKNDIPLVCIDTMNEVHFEEVLIINELLEQLDTKVDFQTLGKSLEKLLEHMQEHFAGEEKLMQETQYPSYRMHQADHTKVLNEARYIEMMWRNRKDEDEIREYLEGELVPWLNQHIQAMDTPMADFVKSAC